MNWVKFQKKCPVPTQVNEKGTKMNSINVCSCVIIIGPEILLAQFLQTYQHLFVCPLNLSFHFTIANKIYSVNGER